MSTCCIKLGSQFQGIRNWFVEDEHLESRERVGRAFAQVALSYTIQKIAITLFGLAMLPSNAVFICTLTAVGFGVAMLAVKSPLAAKVCRVVAQFGIIRLIHETCLTTFIHETGHAVAGVSLFRHTKVPHIEIDLFRGGRTQVAISTLSPLGTFLGRDRAKLLLAAAGPIASVVFSMGMFAWATYQTESADAERLAIHGAVQLSTEIEHVCGAVWANQPLSLGNDFANMRELGGISPAVSLGVIVLLPVIQLLWLNRKSVSSLWSNPSQSQNTIPQ